MANVREPLQKPGSTLQGHAGPTDQTAWLASQLLSSSELALDTALLCVASLAGDVDARGVLETLDAASREMFDVPRADCVAQCERLAQTLTRTLGLTAAAGDADTLLIDRALAGRQAHPLLIACIGSEVARRAGLCSEVCQSSDGWWTVISHGGEFALVGANAAEEPDRRAMRRCCSHQIAGALLELLRAASAEPLASRLTQIAQGIHA
jgi:hypothetical protein